MKQAPLGKRGQATKGTRWIPWYQEARKDVGSCEKLRGVATQTLIRRFPNGETRAGLCRPSCTEYIGIMKRTQGTETSQYLEEKKTNSDSPSSGERTGNSLNLRCVSLRALQRGGRGTIQWLS